MRAGGKILTRGPWFAIPAVIRTVAAVAKASAAFATVAKASALAAVATLGTIITVGLAHHRRRTLFKFFNAHRQITQHILVETFQPLNFVDGGWRCIEVHEREVGFAVLSKPVSKRLHAPLLDLGDLAAHLLDDPFE